MPEICVLELGDADAPAHRTGHNPRDLEGDWLACFTAAALARTQPKEQHIAALEFAQKIEAAAVFTDVCGDGLVVEERARAVKTRNFHLKRERDATASATIGIGRRGLFAFFRVSGHQRLGNGLRPPLLAAVQLAAHFNSADRGRIVLQIAV
jgi:hypothetical protein